jgi:hypothetical protein
MSLRVYYEVLNQKGSPALFTDTLANRPAFGFQGRLFISTDTAQIYEDTGSAWTLIADATGSVIGFVPYSGAINDLNLGTFDLTADIGILNQVKAVGSGGLSFNANSGTQIAVMGAGGGANMTLYGGLSGTTASLSTSVTAPSILGVTNVTFVTEGSDAASISTTVSGVNTYLDFNLRDDILQDEWRWRFTPTSGITYDAMRLVATTSTTSNLIVSGTIIGSNLSGTNTGDVTISTANGLSISSQAISLALASTSTTGALSSTDWTTFNGKQSAITLTTTGTSGAATLIANTLNIPQYSGGGGMAIGGSITSATAGSVLYAGTSGVLAQDNANFFFDATNDRLGIGLSSPSRKLVVQGGTTDAGMLISSSAGTKLLQISGRGSSGTALNQGYLEMTDQGTNKIVLDTVGKSYFNGGNFLVGTDTDNAQGKLQINGGLTASAISVSGATYTVSATLSQQYYHVFNGSTGQTLTLPTPLNNNYQYVVINNTANTVTLAAATSTNIITTTGTSVANITLIANQRVLVIADGNNKYYQIF